MKIHSAAARIIVCAALPAVVAISGQTAVAQPDGTDVAQVKSLLSDRCFLCHGPDDEQRAAELRLDSVEGMTAPLASDDSRRAVVPGNPDGSELMRRIYAEDPDVLMPPPDSELSLSQAEKDLLRRWIANGAEWKGHWSFEPIQRPAVPPVRNEAWCQTDIDRFIVARQEALGLSQNSMADKEHLLRRATFDLTGLPPTLEELDAFLADESADAFEKVVDRLLASDRFGERMAADWLDVARYSDTYGYQVDRDRFVWPWRDWVIDAFNKNLPFDQFVTEQIAGDMLPGATREQRLATTFNRLHPQKVEGGSVPEEFRVEYVADRAQTVATAFLGLTFECCRCHDHKYDPLTQREYYQLFSFFNNIDEAGLYSYFTNSVPTPTLRMPTPTQETQLKKARNRVEQLEEQLQQYIDTLDADRVFQSISSPDIKAQIAQRTADLSKAIPGQVARLDFESGSYSQNRIVESPFGQAVRLTGDHGIDTKVGNFARWQPFSVSTWIKVPQHYDRCVIFHRSRAWTDAGSRGYELLLEDGRLSAALIHFWPGNAIRVRTIEPAPLNEWIHVVMTWDGSSRADGLRLYLNGAVARTETVRDHLYKNITGGGGDTITIGQRFRDKGFRAGLVDEFRVFERELTLPEISHLNDGQTLQRLLQTITDTDADSRKNLSSEELRYLAETCDSELQQLRRELADARQNLNKIEDSLTEIMVMEELPQPRPAFVLVRGAYDAHGDPVTPDVPAALPGLAADMPRNRLGLARWLTAEQNPLTARVTVNRFWQMLFGEGLVRTPEDFGSQGRPPTHPLLLDWLASEFRENGWDVKRLMKQIMMSSVYQQSSMTTADMLKADPENLWLTHAPAFRLSAEMLRDNALAVSGLLNSKIGGPPAKPYELAVSFKPVNPDKGPGLYRRSLYTYWKRTAPAPVMMTLDASKRDVCRVKRERTASPLQSLVLMNGPQFVEAARMLADRLIVQHAGNDDQILTDMYRLLTSRRPSPVDKRILLELFEQQMQAFAANPEAANKYLAVGEAKAQTSDTIRLAAWASVANALLGYDECTTRR